MQRESREVLEERIVEALEGLELLGEGTEEHQNAVADLAKLYSLKIDEMKVELDSADRYEQRLLTERQAELDREQMEKHHFHELILKGLGMAGAAGAFAVKCVFIDKGFRFEETGTFTSKFLDKIVNSTIFHKR